MVFLNWFDWITPTNPYASLFFGILFTIIIGIMVWIDSKSFKTVLVTIITGVVVTGIGTAILNAVGFYG